MSRHDEHDGSGFLLVRNAGAGSDEDEAIAACADLLGGCEVRATEDPEDLDDVLDTLDGRTLVVAGGDGSIHVAVARAWKAGRLDEVTFALIPLGTGNDLARSLGIPLEPEDAARAVLDASTRRLDLLVVDDEKVCINAMHAGIGAVAAQRATGMKAAAGPLAYPLGALSAGATETGWDVIVTVDGTPLGTGDTPVLMVAVANAASIGGGTRIAPDARPDDGRLDVMVAQPDGVAARSGFGRDLTQGEHGGRDDVVTATGTLVEISGEAIPYNIDGELADEPVARRRIAIEPGAWTLLAP